MPSQSRHFEETAVWIAHRTFSRHGIGNELHLGTDDVMVVFTPELGSRIGIPKDR
ncbi:hypothetical protein [Nocardia sp. NBC_01009]|uniref:hypothetical protein n=1 Tax=Nocardia sp. NBC_01009 TaxID=2975996 RepID=UPI00386F25F5|nr:hypothetical protein OHA42_38085 [Nocardia sp. NBC_01009]